MKNTITQTFLIALFLLIGAQTYAQYCVPTTSYDWRDIDEISTTGAMENARIKGITWNNGYEDLSSSARITASPGSAFQMDVSFDQSWSSGGHEVKVFIDFDKNGVFNQTNELVYNGSSTAHPQSFLISIPSNLNLVKPGSTRMRVTGFGGASTSDPCYNGFSDGNAVDLEFFVPPNYSTGISSLTSPDIPICPGSTATDVEVEICNDGLMTVDSVQLGGLIRTASGLVLPMPNVSFKKTIAPGDCEVGSVYNHSAGFNAGDTIVVWTALPNGVPDSLDNNDTVEFIVRPSIPAKSAWTVGDTAGMANDFYSLNEAFDYFEGIGAICDSLIIELDATNNSRNEQYTIPMLSGVGPNTPIVIRGKATNPGRAILQYDSTDVDVNYIMSVSGVEYVYFENISFNNVNRYNKNHSTNISLSNGSNNIHFSNCSFDADYANDDITNTLIIGSGTGENVTIIDCEFNNGSDAIFITGGSTHSVTNCSFRGTFLSSIHFESASNITISNNDISSLSTNVYSGTATNSMGIGIYLKNTSDDLIINNNKIFSSNSQWPRFGIFVGDYNKSIGTNWIYNNMLNIGQPWSSLEFRGITIYRSSFTQVAFNNVAINGNNSACDGLFYNQGTGNALWNNVIAMEVEGVALNQSSLGNLTKSDYNDFWSSGNDIVEISGSGGGTFATLSAYQMKTNFDLNSHQLNPFFYNTQKNDLHVCNNALSKAGTPINAISTDFDGDVRSTTPSIGADEFTPISDVKLTDDYGLCPDDSTELSAGRGNFGETAIWTSLANPAAPDTSQSITVKTSGTYTLTFFSACGVVVDTINIISPDASDLPNDTNLCFGTTLNVDGSIFNGDTYRWSTNDTTSNITISSQQSYSITATDIWGCVSSDNFDVTYSPKADFGLDSTTVCEGADKSVISNVDGTIGATFTWTGYNGSATNRDPGATVADFDLPSKRAYVKVEVNHKGCISKDSILFVTLGRPVIDIADTTNGLLFKVVTNDSPGSTHSWDFGVDGVTDDTSNFRLPKYIYPKTGEYEVTYTNSNICRSKDTTFNVTVIVLDVLESNDGAKFTMYPNPNNGSFSIGFDGINAKEVSVTVQDINGRTIYVNDFGIISERTFHDIELNDIAPGYYSINLSIDGKNHIEKFIVQ